MAGKKKKPRCSECGGTGLRDTEEGITCCDCPAGRCREAAESGIDYYD